MSNIQDRLSFYELDSAQLSTFRSVKGAVAPRLNKALERFYRKVAGVPALGHFFPGEAHMARAKSAQHNHWMGVFQHGIDQDYLDRALKIGDVHARIGLEPKWYIGGYALIAEELVHAMVCPGWRRFLPWRRALARRLSLFLKVAMLDMDIALSTYFDATEQKTRDAIDRLGEALAAVAESDLSVSVSNLPADYGRVQTDFNAAVSALRSVIGSVIETVGVISSGSAEIRTASNDLARRTEQQASALQDVAGSMGEITGKVSATATNAGDARQSIAGVQDEANRGGQVASQAVDAMRSIQTSSDEITQIIAVIDGIAFQTNLLALNAGVEAARAGDAGKGFAVVASEVRALALRSADAAKDIKQLITTSAEHVSRGVQMVGESGEALEGISVRIKELRQVIEEIASASQAQASNVSQVNEAVAQIDRMTQQNAAMVEQTNAAARSLADQADSLQGTVGRFVVEDRGQGAMTSRREAA